MRARSSKYLIDLIQGERRTKRERIRVLMGVRCLQGGGGYDSRIELADERHKRDPSSFLWRNGGQAATMGLLRSISIRLSATEIHRLRQSLRIA